MDKFVGKRLDGRYEIREIIGVGGMAVVYKAYDSIEDRIVAIKILKEEFASNEEFQRRFKNESKAIAVLSHPNIVKVYDVSFGDLIQYIVMEYIEGITLKEYIENNGTLTWSDTVNFTIQILRGLQHAHDKGIVHRDVKPQNIIVLADKTIKVTDFGIARFARKESQTITDKAIGSVHYISPEQAKGEPTDEKADIYSLGVIMYEMLTGTLPFEAESAVSVAIMQLQTEPKLPTHINPLIPMGLEQITMKAMQKDTKNRYKSAAEMLRDLEQFKRDPSTVFHNTYFVDNSPTKAVEDFYYDSPSSESNENEEPENSKVPVISILTGVAVAFIAAI
ncbi:MAG: protein kinase, partial [Acutalibacteraceae bacterium]|nr:protein kinase [Acutalibacteraceae bacterium]